MNRRLGLRNLLVASARALLVMAKVLLICWALLFLAEEFGWHLVREAGGRVVTSISTLEPGISKPKTSR